MNCLTLCIMIFFPFLSCMRVPSSVIARASYAPLEGQSTFHLIKPAPLFLEKKIYISFLFFYSILLLLLLYRLWYNLVPVGGLVTTSPSGQNFIFFRSHILRISGHHSITFLLFVHLEAHWEKKSSFFFFWEKLNDLPHVVDAVEKAQKPPSPSWKQITHFERLFADNPQTTAPSFGSR